MPLVALNYAFHGGSAQDDPEKSGTASLAANLLDDPNIRGIVLNTRDISEHKRLEEQLTHQAFHDPLTHLANRARRSPPHRPYPPAAAR